MKKLVVALMMIVMSCVCFAETKYYAKRIITNMDGTKSTVAATSWDIHTVNKFVSSKFGQYNIEKVKQTTVCASTTYNQPFFLYMEITVEGFKPMHFIMYDDNEPGMISWRQFRTIEECKEFVRELNKKASRPF